MLHSIALLLLLLQVHLLLLLELGLRHLRLSNLLRMHHWPHSGMRSSDLGMLLHPILRLLLLLLLHKMLLLLTSVVRWSLGQLVLRDKSLLLKQSLKLTTLRPCLLLHLLNRLHHRSHDMPPNSDKLLRMLRAGPNWSLGEDLSPRHHNWSIGTHHCLSLSSHSIHGQPDSLLLHVLMLLLLLLLRLKLWPLLDVAVWSLRTKRSLRHRHGW